MSRLIIRNTIRSLSLRLGFCLLLALVGLPLEAPAQMLDSLDHVYVDSALKLLNLKPNELGFDKLWAEDDTFRLAVVEKYLADPLAFPGYMDETIAMVDSFKLKPYDMFEFINRQLIVDPELKLKMPARLEPKRFDSSNPFANWLDALTKAEPLRREFYEKLDSLDLHDLIMAAPGMWSEGGDSIGKLLQGSWQKEFGLPLDTSRKVDSDRLLDIIKKLNPHALVSSAMIAVPAARALCADFEAAGYTAESLDDEIDGVTGDILYYEETQWGRFIIGGPGENVYDGNFAAIVDMGGDDVYRGRQGGALGELTRPYALVIDLSGDDYYNAHGKSVSQGAGFLGIGIVIDREGNDSYRAGGYAQGAGYFGVGYLEDRNGDDDLRGQYFMQGAGHCGVGILLNSGEGDDRYLASTWAQGFAGTFGYGLLYDSGGDDNYRCGGVYLHEPLLPHDNRSFSGGFGMGWRPRAGGGIGMLYDGGTGVDFYDAEVMSFGSSYWYSIGMLYDEGGNDRYSLAHYGIGAGIHLSLGAFYDKAGDDQYRSRMGVVGGTGHDLSVGMFVDGDGDDSYGICDGWGVSLTNSVGLFIDRQGNDTYGTRNAGFSFGDVRWDRGFAGCGIFLDLEGDDVYPTGEPAADSTTWIQMGWGIGMDLARDVVTEKEEPVSDPVLTAEDSARSVEDLWREASQWNVGNARESVAKARKALNTKGMDAIRYAVAERLGTRDGLEMDVIQEVINLLPDSSGPLLIAKLDTTDRYTRGNAAYFLGMMKFKPAVDPLLRLLKKDDAIKVRNSVIGALGQIGEARAAPLIGEFVTDPDQRRRISALNALRGLKNPETIPAVIRGLEDPIFTVRSDAATSLMEFGVAAVPAVNDYVSDKRSAYPELGVKALGRIAASLKDSSGSEYARIRYDADRMFTGLLSDSREQVRAAAVESLYRIGGDATRQLVQSYMEAEYSPVVKAAFKRVKEEK